MQDIWYALYQGETAILDADNNDTGEKQITYSTPTAIKANVSPATGQSDTEMFGNLTDYDRVILTADTTLEIDENSIFWIDTTPPQEPVPDPEEPAEDDSEEEPTEEPTEEEPTEEEPTEETPLGYDYIVKRVARTYNYLAIAVKKIAKDGGGNA